MVLVVPGITNSSTKPHITHCIFDMDGLLLDSERVYTEVASEILDRFGKKFTPELKSKMMGRKALDAVQIMIDEHNLPMTAEDLLAEREEKQKAKFAKCRPLPGVERLVKHLKDHGIPMAVGTSSYKSAYDIKTQENQQLFSLFDAVICGDNPSIKNGKPSPDIFEEAAKKIGNTDPKNCLIFEDSILGVQAGLNAGMEVIWVPDSNMHKSVDNPPKVLQVLTSMEDFFPESVGLPPFIDEDNANH